MSSGTLRPDSNESSGGARRAWPAHTRASVPVERLDVSAYVIPTDAPESDGTYEWNSTTLVLVRARAGDKTGLGYSYADSVTAQLASDVLRDVICGQDAMSVPAAWGAMVHAVRCWTLELSTC